MEAGRATITIERRWAVWLAVATFAVIAGLILALILLAADGDDDGWEHPEVGPGMMAPGYFPGGFPHGGMDPGDMPHGYGSGYGPGSLPPAGDQAGGGGSKN
jgi:hypothetical protein